MNVTRKAAPNCSIRYIAILLLIWFGIMLYGLTHLKGLPGWSTSFAPVEMNPHPHHR